MKNKKILFSLIALTATACLSAKIISIHRKKGYSSDETVKQAAEYKKAINEVLNEEYLKDFDDFAAALSECYGITAFKCDDGETVEYSSDKYYSTLTSKDVIRKADNTEIRLESMCDLYDYFIFN